MNTPLGTAALCSIHQSQQFCCCYCTYQFRMHQHTCLIQFNLYFFQLLSSGTRTVIRKRVQENLMIKVAKTVTKPVFHPVDVITSVATPILHPVQTVSAVTEYLNFFPKKSQQNICQCDAQLVTKCPLRSKLFSVSLRKFFCEACVSLKAEASKTERTFSREWTTRKITFDCCIICSQRGHHSFLAKRVQMARHHIQRKKWKKHTLCTLSPCGFTCIRSNKCLETHMPPFCGTQDQFFFGGGGLWSAERLRTCRCTAHKCKNFGHLCHSNLGFSPGFWLAISIGVLVSFKTPSIMSENDVLISSR